MPNKKYYWLKLQKDFFKRHDIKIIKSMPNGKEYVIFYLTLLLESLGHDGSLRFSETIPYNEEMLSVVTDTNIDIVRSAMKILIELNMVEIMDDSTIYMTEVDKMLGCETNWAEKKRLYRGQCPQPVLPMSDKSKSIEKEIELELDIKKEGEKRKRFTPPILEEVAKYCKERQNGIDVQHFIDFYSAKDWMIGKNKMKDWKASVRTWETRHKPNNNSDIFLEALEDAKNDN